MNITQMGTNIRQDIVDEVVFMGDGGNMNSQLDIK